MLVKSAQKSPCVIAWCPVNGGEIMDNQSTTTTTTTTTTTATAVGMMVGGRKKNNIKTTHSLLALGQRSFDQSTFNSVNYLEIVDTAITATVQLDKMPTLGTVELPNNLQITALSWGTCNSQTSNAKCPLGLIAVGLDNGNVNIWNASLIIENDRENAAIHELKCHEGGVNGVEWNSCQPNLLATCGPDGKVCVWNFERLDSPSKSTIQVSEKSLTCLSWHPSEASIIAIADDSGAIRIYHIGNPNHPTHTVKSPIGRSSITSVSWHPNHVRLLTVMYDDGTVKVWDLKQTSRELLCLQHGSEGRLAWSWCKHDLNVLMTAGGDSKGVLWRANEGKRIHEVTFDVPYLAIAWNPLRPGCLAGSSYDGKISIYEINYTGPTAPPPWLGRKSGVCWGFAGRLFSFGQEYVDLMKPSSTRDGKKLKKVGKECQPPRISVQSLPVESSMIARAQQFQQILSELRSPQDLQAFAEQKTEENEWTESKAWEMIRLFYEKDSRAKMLAYLGFAPQAEPVSLSPMPMAPLQTLDVSDSESEQVTQPQHRNGVAPAEEEAEADDDDNFWANIQGAETHKKVENNEDEDEDSADFFVSKKGKEENEEFETNRETENLEEESNKNKRKEIKEKEKEKNKPKEIKKIEITEEVPDQSKEVHTEADLNVKNALIIGNYKRAVDLALRAGNMADALMLAYDGGEELWESARKAYFARHRSSFFKNVYSYVSNDNYQELVLNADLKNWKETLAIILSFCKEDTSTQLCNLLAQRLVREGDINGAMACYLCSHNVPELINLWTSELLGTSSTEEGKMIDSSKTEVSPDMVLHECIEKALVFINAPCVRKSKESVNALADVLSQYAALLANQGSLQISEQFLKFISDPRCPAGTYANEETQSLLQRIAFSQSELQYQPTTNSGATAAIAPVNNPNPQVAPVRTHQGEKATVNPQNPIPTKPIRARRSMPIGTPTHPTLPQNQSQQLPSQPVVSQPQQMPPTHHPRPVDPRMGRMTPYRPPPASEPEPATAPLTQPEQAPPSRGRVVTGGPIRPMQRASFGMPSRARPDPITRQDESVLRSTNPNTIGNGDGITQQSARSSNGRRPPPPIDNRQLSTPAHPPREVEPNPMPIRRASALSGDISATRATMPTDMRNLRQGPPYQVPNPVPTPISQMPTRAYGMAQTRDNYEPAPISPPKTADMMQYSHSNTPVETQPKEEVKAKKTSGTGFYGETNLKPLNAGNQSLPETSMDTVQKIFDYLDDLESFLEDPTDKKSVEAIRPKLEILKSMVANNQISVSAYSKLVEMTENLRSGQYLEATKVSQKLSSNTQEFKANQHWITSFRTLVGLGRKYSLKFSR